MYGLTFYCLDGLRGTDETIWTNKERRRARLTAVKQFYYCWTNIAQPICIIERPLGATGIVILCRAVCQIHPIIYACGS